MCWIQGAGFVVYSFWQCCLVQSLWLWQGLSLSVSNSKWVSGRSLSPPAGRLEYCCGKSFLWATCRTRVKPTRRSWSLSPVVGGWILLRAALDQCEYWEDVHQSLMQWRSTVRMKLFILWARMLMQAESWNGLSLIGFICVSTGFCHCGRKSPGLF